MRRDLDPFAATIEQYEQQWMSAWMRGDRATMKTLTAKDFVLLLGSEQPVLLDRASWLDGATERFRCHKYRFADIYVRRHKRTAIFAARLSLETSIAAHDWSGDVWLTDLWRQGRLRRGWKLVERVLSRPDHDSRLAGELRAMQLWR